MDPNANLREQLEIAGKLRNGPSFLDHDEGPADDELDTVEKARGAIKVYEEKMRELEVDADRLAELVVELNEWRLKGGFAPEPIAGMA